MLAGFDRPRTMKTLLAAAVLPFVLAAASSQEAAPGPWCSWRGPQQDGTSLETGLPAELKLDAPGSWTYPLAGRGTPVIHEGRVYALGYEGEGAALQEVLVCLDEKTGKRLWEQRASDFLSDTVYYRFSIGAPTVDPVTDRVYWLSTPGVLACFEGDGRPVWQLSMMADHGRLTFPNGRTGAPLVDGDLVIVHPITAAWGSEGPARDRFYAFDKASGRSVWTTAPGILPVDNSMSLPVVEMLGDRRVLYTTTGCGHLVCLDVRTGEPLWRYQMCIAGMNSSVLLHGDHVIAIHGVENADSSTSGRMAAVRRKDLPAAPPGKGPLVLDKSHEAWRNELGAFSSSPVLVGNRVYVTVETGDLCAVDATTGHVLWREKLAPDQVHASPVWADGRLFVPMNNGSFFVVVPPSEDDGAGKPRIAQTLQLEGNCLGAPAVANGRVYVHTTAKLYCFGGGAGQAPAWPVPVEVAASGSPARLQVVPADFVVQQGDSVPMEARLLDAAGRRLGVAAPGEVTWSGLPKGVAVDERGVLQVAKDALASASVVKAVRGELSASIRLRIVRAIPFKLDFEAVELKPHAKEPGLMVAPTPSWWAGGGPKWEILDLAGSKVLARTIGVNPMWQRTQTFLGLDEMSNYTMQADVYSDGNRRSMSAVGVLHQRYLIQLKGNHQELEVSSNQELLKVHVPFQWTPKTWYRLKTRVDVASDGSGVVRAKAWKRGDPEPEAWTIEVPHAHAHRSGTPGVYGFTLQNRFRVYIDNLEVTAND
jgi:outer membrane protein assembly factor BamB